MFNNETGKAGDDLNVKWRVNLSDYISRELSTDAAGNGVICVQDQEDWSGVCAGIKFNVL